MRERLMKLMQLLNLTPTQFANSIGVQRATFQHILTGRNEPSLKIVMAVHNSFPQVDIEWLLNGTGNPYGDRELPDTKPNDYPLFPGMDAVIPAEIQEIRENKNLKEEKAPLSQRKRLNYKDVKTDSDAHRVMSGKLIKEVVIFFEDGTYQKISSDLKK